MCVPFLAAAAIATTVLTAGAAIYQGEATKQAYDYQAKVDKNNAVAAGYQRQNALAEGTYEEQLQRNRLRAIIGSQRAAFGSGNVDASSGSALDTIVNTADQGMQDELTIRANAARQAWGFQVEQNNYLSDAALKKSSGRNALTGGILSAGATLFGARMPSSGSGMSLADAGTSIAGAFGNYSGAGNYGG